MARRFYFTAMNYDDEDVYCSMSDHIGNIRGARTKAQKYANENSVIVIINSSGGEILDWIYPDTYASSEETPAPEENAEVETTEMCPHCEEEITLTHDVSKGYKTICPNCGKRLMLCDLCQHRDELKDENGYIISQGDCNYSSKTDSCRFNPERQTRAG